MITPEDKVALYDATIEQLDKEHAEMLANQPMPTGNRKTVSDEVAQRMVAEKAYQDKKQRLIELRNEAMEVSPGVASFLNETKVPSKFDVDEGTEKLDDSNEIQGKSI